MNKRSNTGKYITEFEQALPNNAIKLMEIDIEASMLAFLIRRGYNTSNCYRLYDWYYVKRNDYFDGIDYDRIRIRK